MAAPEVTTETPEAFAARNVRWNAPALLFEAGLFIFGLAVFDGSTVMPTLLNKLGASDFQIGIMRFFQMIGFALPSLIAAHYIHGRAFHKRFMVGTTAIGRSLVQTLWPVILFLGLKQPTFVLTYLLFVYSAFWLVDGFCAVSWTDIVAKAIPSKSRGLFFGLMQTFGGIFSVIAASIMAWVLHKDRAVFPDSYAILAACWAGSSVLSFLFLISIREPQGTHLEKEEKPNFVQFIVSFIPLLKKYPRIRSIILLRWTLDGAGMATPFYVLYAQQNMHIAPVMLGIYVGVKSIGKILTGPLWGHISDRYSPILTIRLIAICIVAIPILCILAPRTNPLLMVLLFFLLGGIEDGLWTTCQNLMYSSVSEHDRPLAIGVVTTALVICAAYSLLGGRIAGAYGYIPVFVLAMIFAFVGLLVALLIPRHIVSE